MNCFLTSFVVTALVTPLVIWLAHRLGWVAKPRKDRWHQKPTALMGGIGIFVGAAVGWITCGELENLMSLLIPGAGIFILGYVDDRLNLKPHVKLIGQIAICATAMVGGVSFHALPPILALPFTMFWLIAITNAINLLDNMDGLAAGVSGVTALVLAFYSILAGDGSGAPAALALAGSCVAFLIYNFNPARVFMGDCGSMFLGFSLAAIAIHGPSRSAPNLILALLVPVVTLAIPIFDTTLVSATRALHGRPISQGGRDHSSHRLVSLGLSERGTVLVLYALTALFGSISLVSMQLPGMVVVVLSALLFIGLAVLGTYLGYLKVYPEDASPPAHVALIGGTLMHKKLVLQVLMDMILVPIAFVGAHLLRFEAMLTVEVKQQVLTVLPVVMVLKLAALAVCGAYRGVWRYAEPVDALKAVMGSILGSLACVAALGTWTAFKHLSRTAVIIDFALFTLLVITVRMAYVMLRDLFGLIPAKNGPSVLILGAGPEASALIRRLRDPLSATRATIVGILADEPNWRGRALSGVPVLGLISDLPDVLRANDVHGCILGVSALIEEGRKIVEWCEQYGVSVCPDPELVGEERILPELGSQTLSQPG